MLDHPLGKGYLCGGSLIPDADCEINVGALPVGEIMVAITTHNSGLWIVGAYPT